MNVADSVHGNKSFGPLYYSSFRKIRPTQNQDFRVYGKEALSEKSGLLCLDRMGLIHISKISYT